MSELLYDIDRENAITALQDYPYFVLRKVEQDTGVTLNEFRDELIEIKKYYVLYKKGAGFTPEGSNGDYVPTKLRFRKMKNLINKEARFMFSQTPDIRVISQETDVEDELKQYQLLIDKVIERNNISKTLLQAAKDCFVGKRVACLVELSEAKGIIVKFYDALHFYSESSTDTDDLVRFVCYEKLDTKSSTYGTQYLVKEYVLVNGKEVYATVSICDKAGKAEVTQTTKLDMETIPAVVITNDGVLSDKKGVSEISEMSDLESTYSLLSGSDTDSIRRGANPVYVLVDMNPETTKGLSIAPGSLWDVHSDQNQDEVHPQALTLSPPLTHSEPLKTTLQRINQAMHESVEVPDISSEGLLSGITSFKALKALYFDLSVRCDEKLKTWIPALQKVFKFVIKFAILEPDIINGIYALSVEGGKTYDILIQQNYALLEDENEEKQIDLQEVQTKAMSVLSYLKKWRSDELRTDKQRQDELMQIAMEANMFDSASLNMNVNSELAKQLVNEDVKETVKEVEVKSKQKEQVKESILEDGNNAG